MNLLFIQSTRTSPEVRINTAEKVLIIEGRSSPENAIEFYQKIYNAVDSYFAQKDSLTVNLLFEYFNTSSSKCLFNLFRKFKKYQEEGKNLVINWYYEEYDEDMLETGEDFAEIIAIDIDLIEVPDGEGIPEVINIHE